MVNHTANELEAVCDKYTLGIHCKACDKPLVAADLDPEMCGECLRVVMEYNQDVDRPDNAKLDKGDFEFVGQALDYADVSWEEYRRGMKPIFKPEEVEVPK